MSCRYVLVVSRTVASMNGPEHYAAAERLLASAMADDMEPGDPGEVSNLAAAQVHATLALAAATALAAIPDWAPGSSPLTSLPADDAKAWREVAGVTKK